MRGDPSGRKVSVQDGEGDTKKEKKEKKVKVAAVMWCLSCEKTSGTSERERERGGNKLTMLLSNQRSVDLSSIWEVKARASGAGNKGRRADEQEITA